MTVDVKPGARLVSACCEAEFVVVKTPAPSLDLRCGGHPLLPAGGDKDGSLAPESGFDGGVALGKRYSTESGDLELLCTKAGKGSLSLGDETLDIKDAKPLPASD